MRTLLGALCLILAACGGSHPVKGWEYRPAKGPYAARLFYRFGDGDGTTLIGSCNGEPSFVLSHGGWSGPTFTLTVDDQSWNLPTMQGAHGHYLPVDQAAPNQAIADAKRRIVFEVGNWRREIVPDAPLNSFVRDCGE